MLARASTTTLSLPQRALPPTRWPPRLHNPNMNLICPLSDQQREPCLLAVGAAAQRAHNRRHSRSHAFFLPCPKIVHSDWSTIVHSWSRSNQFSCVANCTYHCTYHGSCSIILFFFLYLIGIIPLANYLLVSYKQILFVVL